MNKYIKKHIKMSNAARATIWFTLSNILEKGIGFLSTPIYTRILSTEQYGEYSIFLSWLELFEIIATFRIAWDTYVVGIVKYEDDRELYTASLQTLSLIITTGFLIVYIIFRAPIDKFTHVDTAPMLIMIGIIYVMPAIRYWKIRKRVDFDYMKLFLFIILFSIGTLFVGIIATYFFKNKYLAIIFSRFLFQGGIGFFLILCNYHGHIFYCNKKYWSSALHACIPLLPHYLSEVVLHSSDRIIIGNICGKKFSAIYSVAYILSSCMLVFNQSFTYVIQPLTFKKIKKGDYNSIQSKINLSLWIVVILNCLMIVIAPELINIIAPKEYSKAVYIVPALAASCVIMYVYQQFVNIEFYYSANKYIAIASCGAAIINILLNYLYIPRYGYLAAGYTTLVSYLFLTLVHYIVMLKISKKMVGVVLIKILPISLQLIPLVICMIFSIIGYRYLWVRVALFIAIIILAIVIMKTFERNQEYYI